MSERIRISELRERRRLYASGPGVMAKLMQHEIDALLDAVEAAKELYGGEEPNDNERTWQRLDETLRRFDFDA